MRQLAVSLGLGLLLVSGCDPFGHVVRPDPNKTAAVTNAPPPQAAQLVAYLNDNARRVQTVQATRVDIDCKQGNESIGLDAKLVCSKPRYFRLKGQVLGKPAVDIGSNDDEFWYWISQQKPPYVCHCSYQDLGTGQVRLPFPFQPDMLICAMGIADYDSTKAYDVRVVGQTVELISEPTLTPAGKRVRKVTVFNRFETKPPKPQIIAHLIKDETGQEMICKATIQEVVLDPATNAILPKLVHLSWPAEKMEMTLRMHNVQSTRLEATQAAKLFNRTDLSVFPGFDLARMKPDHPQGISQNGLGLQRVGGQNPAWGR